MSILFSGDFHANAIGELDLITEEALIVKYGEEIYSGIKHHIILGDGGFMWPHNVEKDKYNYKMLAKRPFPVLCVLGNHEPIYGMKNVPEAEIGIGEAVYKINAEPFVAYLKRGKVYVIDGIKFLVLGGALSIDKYCRIPNVTWWEKEYWDEQEKKDLFALLETENTFDCVISHTGPSHINEELLQYSDNYYDKTFDEAAILNDEIHKRIR
ncbi:MAG: metallophosphoesterase, partial [Treponema sp.]|nr:metallophosphoesterase [Treponema sp.]